jgi:hypothetical protein
MHELRACGLLGLRKLCVVMSEGEVGVILSVVAIAAFLSMVFSKVWYAVNDLWTL